MRWGGNYGGEVVNKGLWKLLWFEEVVFKVVIGFRGRVELVRVCMFDRRDWKLEWMELVWSLLCGFVGRKCMK